MTYQTEFTDFPPETMPPIPAGWADLSWANDTCPCFDTGNGRLVFVDFADPALREVSEGPRFAVVRNPEIDGEAKTLFESDDWDAILQFVRTP